DSPFSAAAGWKQSSVSIPLPCTGVKFASEADAPRATVGGIFHRDIVEVATSAFQDTAFFDYHMKGYKLMWKPSEDEAPQRVYGETYTSDVFLEMEEEIFLKQPVDDPPVETVVVPLMYYSDGTQLAAFGSASLWPGYAWVGNQSKYTRDPPTTFSAHHFAYYSKVFVLLYFLSPDDIQDVYRKTFGTTASDVVLSFLRRELWQEIWTKLLLTDGLKEAYENGILVKCADGIMRRLYIRFFTYSADYKEKVLIACIKHLGTRLCPRCLIDKAHVPDLGSEKDRKIRINKARVDNKNSQHDRVKNLFKSKSLVPVEVVFCILECSLLNLILNALSTFLRESSVNFYAIVPPDVLYEIDLGVWKNLFIHLVRIFHSQKTSLKSIEEMNDRYVLASISVPVILSP
ncbi:hypothetical protein B0H11DRAFT_1732841, partial [Mycena galericulata]